jgi:hypothetical protein
MDVYLTGVHLMGVYLINEYLTGVHLMSVHLMSVYLMGVYLWRRWGQYIHSRCACGVGQIDAPQCLKCKGVLALGGVNKGVVPSYSVYIDLAGANAD